MVVLESERLFLRPWVEEDAPRLFQLACDPEIGPRAGWPVHTSAENSLDIIRGVLRANETYAMVEKATGKIAGSIGLKEPDVRAEYCSGRQLEIGYWIGREYWGRGLTPEAVEILLRRGFEDLDCAVIWCAHYDFNAQSRRVIEKCGFRYQLTKETTNLLGMTHPTLFYSLTKEEWQKL